MDNQQHKLLWQDAAEQLEADEATPNESPAPVLTSTSQRRSQQRRNRSRQTAITVAKVFLAAAIVWMSYVAVRRLNRFRRRPVSLLKTVDMETLVDGISSENTEPPLAVILPNPRTRQELRRHVREMWDKAKVERNPKRKERLMGALQTGIEAVQTLAKVKTRQN